jgi:cytochrome c peroxidase
MTRVWSLASLTTAALAAAAASACVGASTAESTVAVESKVSPTSADNKCKHFDDGQGADAFQTHVKHVLQLQAFANPKGALATYTTAPIVDDDGDDAPRLDTDNPFFKPLGTNGRACVSCHDPANGWGTSAETLQARFEDSCGLDPIFRPIDGANSPDADVSSVDARRSAYSLLLNKGLIRIELPIPANADYTLVSVDDPNGNDTAGLTKISVFRRPLPSTNLRFAPRTMWDGREPNLTTQAINATLVHAETTSPPSQADVDAIVAFETSLFTTQVLSNTAGSTSDAGATGDPIFLFNQPFFLNGNPGVAHPISGPPHVLTIFTEDGFTLFDAWKGSEDAARAQIARGQEIFDSSLLTLLNVFIPPNGTVTIKGSCTTCHNAVNAGSFTAPQGFGPQVGPRGGFTENLVAAAQFRTPDVPLFTFRRKSTGQILKVTDPGMGAITGLFADLGRFKAPNLRGLAGRAPYFHNGMAATLRDVVNHYNGVMAMNLSEADKAALTAYLETL